MKQSIALLTLFLCLNNRLYSTDRQIAYFPVEKTVKVDNAVDMNQSCFVDQVFKNGFENIQNVLEQNVVQVETTPDSIDPIPLKKKNETWN